MSFDVRVLFSKDALVKQLTVLPELESPVMDGMFAQRPTHPWPILGAAEVEPVAGTLPMVRRGSPSIATGMESRSHVFYEPLPFRINDRVSAREINDLRTMGGESREGWARNKTDLKRREIRMSTEAVCAQVLANGRIQWPVKLEGGGYDTFDVDFGTIPTVNVAAGHKWDHADCTIEHILGTLNAVKKQISKNGYGSQIEYWMGETAWEKLWAKVRGVLSSANIVVAADEQSVTLPGYTLRLRNEEYVNPQTGTAFSAVPAKEIRAFSKTAGHRLYYCAIDDLDGNLQPLPFFVKTIEEKDPSGVKLIAESKPFPVPNLRGMCKAAVVS